MPSDYVAVILTLLALSALAVLRVRGRSFAATDAHFLLLGVGFLLLETKSITDCSLYFGTTWLVTMVVVAGVLLMVLAANAVAVRLKRASLWLYLPLFVSLAVLSAVPRAFILGFPLAGRLGWTLLLVPLPLFFAGLIFSVTFREESSRPGANTATLFGANLLGATVGGFCEYLGMATGSRWLMTVGFRGLRGQHGLPDSQPFRRGQTVGAQLGRKEALSAGVNGPPSAAARASDALRQSRPVLKVAALTSPR